MKFKVREGYVVRIVRIIDLGNDKTDKQEITAYGGQTIDLSEDEANEHAHKLEALDKPATALLDGKVRKDEAGETLGVSDAQLAFAKALATAVAAETAKAVVAALQSPAPAAAEPAGNGG